MIKGYTVLLIAGKHSNLHRQPVSQLSNSESWAAGLGSSSNQVLKKTYFYHFDNFVTV